MRIQTQTRHDRRYRTDGIEELQGSVSAIPDDDQTSVWLPAMHDADELSRPERQRLVAPTPLVRAALGRGQRCEKRQRPDSTCPRDGRKQVQRDPAQPAYLDEMAMAGADWIAIDACRSDLHPADHDEPGGPAARGAA